MQGGQIRIPNRPEVVARLPEGLPLYPLSLAGDTDYRNCRLRHHRGGQSITAYIRIHPKQQTSMVASGAVTCHGDHLICTQGKTLCRGALEDGQAHVALLVGSRASITIIAVRIASTIFVDLACPTALATVGTIRPAVGSYRGLLGVGHGRHSLGILS